MSINGNLVHTLSTNDGYALGWGSAVECGESNCGTVPAHSEFFYPTPLGSQDSGSSLNSHAAWINTVITMDVADPNYKNTLAKGQGVTGDLVTSDGGKTWTVSKISIPGFDFSTGKIVTASSAVTTTSKTTTKTTTAAAATTTASSSTGGTAARWAQCGGETDELQSTWEVR